MTSDIIVERTVELPDDLEREVVPAADQEGFKPIEVLQRHWADGRNRFDMPGEAFYAARSDGRLVGVCGLNRDPYSDEASTGRLRRLYVLPAFRRMGVGSSLVRQAVLDADDHFAIVRLRTLDEDSARFFQTVGFQKIEGEEAATHQIRFDGGLTPLILQDATPNNSLERTGDSAEETRDDRCAGW